MEINKIKFYCQFCLKLQHKDDLKMPISRKLKQNFFDITQKKLTTSAFSEFICCQPCLEEFEAFNDYRNRLITNQKCLEDLLKKVKRNHQKIDDEEEVQTVAVEIEDSDVPEVVQDECDEEMNVIEEKIDEVEEEQLSPQHLEDSTTFELIEEEYLDEEHIIEEVSSEAEEYITFESTADLEESAKKKYQRKKLKDPIKCPKCSRLFFYKSYFAFHYKDVHSQDQAEVCQYCGKVFKNMRRLNSHILIHTQAKKFKCDVCDKNFNYSGDLLRHKRIHENKKPYKCHFEDCGKSFVQSYALKLHLDVHNRVKFACDKCGAQYSVKTTLKNHIQKCINGIQPVKNYKFKGNPNSDRERYKCFIEGCEREFSSRKYLGVHLERNHQVKFENFDTTCLECHMAFDNVGDYAKHVKIHSCSFVCEICKLRFRTKEKLENHKEKLHKEGDDRPYVCQEEGCGARFKRSEHLTGHQLYKHSDIKKFACPQCPLKFRQRGEFNVHMRVHQDLKPFSCWKCDHLCKTSSNLRQHMRLVHDGETNIYFCEVCHVTFKYSVDLTQHKKEQGHGEIGTVAKAIEQANATYEVVEIMS